MRKVQLRILTVLLLAAASAVAEETKPTPAQTAAVASMKQKLGAGFTVKRVGVFAVAWDLDAEAGAAYEQFILEVQGALYKDFFVKRPTGVFKIALFRDTASLQKNAKKLATKSAVMPMGGFYLPYERVICTDTTGGRWMVQHEVTHALLHADLGRENWPASTVTPWIDEGMASLIESAALKDGAFAIVADWRLRFARRMQTGGTLPKLRDVFKMDFATYNSPKNRMACDVVSRTFLYWLHEKAMLMPFYKAWRAEYNADPSGITFLERATQKTLDQVESDWHAWLEAQDTPAPAKAPVPAE